MVRLLALAVFWWPLSQAHGFAELFEADVIIPQAWAQDTPAYSVNDMHAEVTACRYVFGWGRNSVSITNMESARKSECTFSHTERVQIPRESTSNRQAIFFQHYTCTDGSRAYYSTNWLGGEFFLRHSPNAEVPSLKCD